jgi:hypothetical protein
LRAPPGALSSTFFWRDEHVEYNANGPPSTTVSSIGFPTNTNPKLRNGPPWIEAPQQPSSVWRS